MSEALTPEAPATDGAAPEVSGQAPPDGTAVESGSAGQATTPMVEATRFNGLMSAHQKALSDLEAERTMRVALEARLTQHEETPSVVTDEATLNELQQLRSELQAERLEAAKAKALEKYPAAAPLADLIIGNTPADIENIAAQIATRLGGVTPPPVVDTTPVVDAAGEVAPAEDAAPVAPVVAGGSTAPVQASNQEAVAAALEAKSWPDFWKAKANPDVAQLA